MISKASEPTWGEGVPEMVGVEWSFLNLLRSLHFGRGEPLPLLNRLLVLVSVLRLLLAVLVPPDLSDVGKTPFLCEPILSTGTGPLPRRSSTSRTSRY